MNKETHGESIEISINNEGTSDVNVSPAGISRLSAALTTAINLTDTRTDAMRMLARIVDTNFTITNDETDTENYALTGVLLQTAVKAADGELGEEFKGAMEAGREAGFKFMSSMSAASKGAIH